MVISPEGFHPSDWYQGSGVSSLPGCSVEADSWSMADVLAGMVGYRNDGASRT